MSQAGSTGNAGFTLLEILVVLVILSLASTTLGLGIPSARERTQLASAGAQLDATLLEARSQARREGAIRTVVFDLSARRYRIGEKGDWHVLPNGVEMSVVSARELGALTTAAVAFLPDGTSSGADITLAVAGLTTSRRVEWLTGRLRHEKP